MKIIYGYPNFPSLAYGDVEKPTLDYISRVRNSGIDVSGVCLSINPPSHCLTFPQLDKLWKRGDKKLLTFYEDLLRKIEGCDVFINSVGINLHPEFVESIKALTVFQCNDDPESSELLSRPVATSYDMCLIGNIAEVETYKSWGVKNAYWRPIGLQPEIYSRDITENEILHGERDIDLFMMLDRNFPARKARLDQLDLAFPNSHFYGAGWKRGFLPVDEQLNFLRRAKIGPNIHNSTGPINYRTFYLPANGVMQICDNKSHLGKIYELNKEVVGYDTMKECIELCHYYLNHEQERRQIALNGWKRVRKDYNEITIFKNDIEKFKLHLENKKIKKEGSEYNIIECKKMESRGMLFCFFQDLPELIDKGFKLVNSVSRKIIKRILYGKK